MNVLECSNIDVVDDLNIDCSINSRSLFIAKRFLSPKLDTTICPISSSATENKATDTTSSLKFVEDQNSAIENFVRCTENANLGNLTARFLALNGGDCIQDSDISFINLIKSKYDFQVAFIVRVPNIELLTKSALSCSIDRKCGLMIWS